MCDTAEPLADAPSYARSVARAALVDAGVELACGVRAGALGGRQAGAVGRQLPGGRDRALGDRRGGTGLLAASGLACDAAGCMRVDATLRSISHGFVFAAGDCAAIEGNPRPKSGVWAVRAGAPLAAQSASRRTRPGAAALATAVGALAILGLGDGRALAWRNGMAVSGRPVWRWKDWIDRRWMRMYQEPMAPMQGDDPMRCGGCGAKVGAEVLAGALADLPRLPGAGCADRARRAGRCGGDAATAGDGGGAERRSFPRLHRRSVRVRRDRRGARAVRPARDGRAALDRAGGGRGALHLGR